MWLSGPFPSITQVRRRVFLVLLASLVTTEGRGSGSAFRSLIRSLYSGLPWACLVGAGPCSWFRAWSCGAMVAWPVPRGGHVWGALGPAVTLGMCGSYACPLVLAQSDCLGRLHPTSHSGSEASRSRSPSSGQRLWGGASLPLAPSPVCCMWARKAGSPGGSWALPGGSHWNREEVGRSLCCSNRGPLWFWLRRMATWRGD